MKHLLTLILILMVLVVGCSIFESKYADCINDEFLRQHDISKAHWLSSTELMGKGLTGEQIMDIRDQCRTQSK